MMGKSIDHIPQSAIKAQHMMLLLMPHPPTLKRHTKDMVLL
jgi:hypothetical protein